MADQVTTEGRILGVILVIVGLVLLLTRFTDLDVGGLWPLFLLVPGVALLAIGLSGSDRVAETATVVGAPITTIGLLLTYQNLTDHWESWSYAWALVLGAVGVGRWLWGVRADSPEHRQTGARLAGVGVVIFVVGLLVFEGVIGVSGRDLGTVGDVLLPIVIVLGGLWLLLRPIKRSREGPSETRSDSDPG